MFYRRHLPHWQKTDSALFITWRLYGSLPVRSLAAAQHESNAGKRFVLLDRELDRALCGPTWLRDVRVAELVVNALHYGAEHPRLFRLSAYVVMSNHVHVLIWPRALLPGITKSIKGFTAREANRILGLTGKRFGRMNRLITRFETKRSFIGSRDTSRGTRCRQDWSKSPRIGRGRAGQSRTDILVCRDFNSHERQRDGSTERQAGMPVLPWFIAAFLALLFLRLNFPRARGRGGRGSLDLWRDRFRSRLWVGGDFLSSRRRR
jgi:REP element-mobilizing transposase RayT